MLRLVLSTLLLLLLAGESLAYETIKMEVAGRTRVARVFPGRHASATPSPLLIVFHGRGDREGNFLRAVRLHRDWPEATVVYPRGERVVHDNNMRGWLGGQVDDVNNDKEFVLALLERLKNDYAVDDCRTYASGFSNGGRFVFVLMTELPDLFAAYVPVGAASRYIRQARQPRPVMYLFGRFEPKIYEEAWRNTVTTLAKLNRATGDKLVWSGSLHHLPPSTGGADTVYGLYEGGHQWPKGLNGEIVRFLRSHASCATDPTISRPAR